MFDTELAARGARCQLTWNACSQFDNRPYESAKPPFIVRPQRAVAVTMLIQMRSSWRLIAIARKVGERAKLARNAESLKVSTKAAPVAQWHMRRVSRSVR